MALLALFKEVRYTFLALVVAILVFFSVSLFSQTGILFGIIPDVSIALSGKIRIILAVLYGALTEITISSLLTAIISILFGISVAGLVYYFRLYKATAVSAMSALSTGGAISWLVALGCASCGSLVVGFLSSFFSASSVLIFISYQSTLFGLLSVTMLLVSMYLLNKKLSQI